MKVSKLKVCVIGCGMIGNVAHIPAYKNLSDKVDIVACFDPRTEAAEGTAKRHGIQNWYTDVEEMLKKEKPDLVSICTPNVSHKELVLMALSFDANVVCEKPLALTYTDAKEMFNLANSRGKVLTACQTLRYNTEYLVAKEFASNGSLGDIYFSEFSYIRRRGVPKWGTFHIKGINGGGAFCDIAVHLVDAVLWVMGNPDFVSINGDSASVIARNETDIITSLAESGAPAGVPEARAYLPEEFEVEEFASGTIRLNNNSSINFKVSWAVNLPLQYNVSIAGSKAGIVLPEMQLYSTIGRYQADIKPRVFEEGKYAGKDFAGHYYLIENLVNHLVKGIELMVKPEETLNAISIIDAFYLSAKEKREVLKEEVVK